MLNYRILLCDDDGAYAKSLQPLAALYDLDVHHFLTWEESQIELEQNFELYGAVILDALGQRNTDANRNDIGALTSAVRWLQKKEGEGCYMPYVINSAFVETSVKTGFDDIIHFDKTQKQEKDLFKKVKDLIVQRPSFQLKLKYKKAFESIGGKYLPAKFESKMEAILFAMEGNIVSQSDFNSIREILEGMFIRANKIHKSFIPNDLIKADGRPTIEWCYRYLSGLPTDVKNSSGALINSYPAKSSITPAHISKTIDYVKSNSSILSHAYAEQWSKYSFDSLVLGMIEVLIWFKQYIDKNYP